MKDTYDVPDTDIQAVVVLAGSSVSETEPIAIDPAQQRAAKVKSLLERIAYDRNTASRRLSMLEEAIRRPGQPAKRTERLHEALFEAMLALRRLDERQAELTQAPAKSKRAS